MLTLKVNEILIQKEKSCYWLAKQCNMSPNNMGKICNGETSNIRLETLEKICKALNCTPNDIITSDDPEFQRLLEYRYRFKEL